MKADDLKRQWKDACDYIAKHGAPEPHFRGSSVGRLHRADVATEICHQASPSAQNYWKSSHFDAALGDVIKRRFSDLAAEALADLKKKYEDALRAEKDQLLARLAEIQAIEEQV
jgi:uncharacterized membrane protein YheB (UPF0754 family)